MKKKIEELFRLAMKAQEKTSAYVSFQTSNHGWECVVMIMDNGFEVKHGYDGWYEMDMFYPDERSEKQYQKAKEHLIRLLRKKEKGGNSMNTVAKLTQKQIEKLAVEIRTFLLEHDMWVDTQIYFNGKCFDTRDKKTGEFYYNDPEHLIVRENEDPRRYFENVAEDHILSMAFEGSVCHMLWYGTNPGIKKKFDRIFEKRGIYYEFGDHWNFTCYYIGE